MSCGELAGGQRGQPGEEEDRDQVLDDEDGQHQIAQPPDDAQFSESLDDDGGAGDGDDRAGIEALLRAPAECAAREIACPDLGAHFDDGHQSCRRSDAEELSDGEFEADAEEQQDDAQLRQPLDGFVVRGDGSENVRADDDAGEQVAEHDGLPEALEDDCGNRGDAEHEGEVGEEDVRVHRSILALNVSLEIDVASRRESISRDGRSLDCQTSR